MHALDGFGRAATEVIVSPGLTQLMSSLLFGVRAADALTFMIVTGALVIVALAACFVPARRAVGIQPATVLRND